MKTKHLMQKQLQNEPGASMKWIRQDFKQRKAQIGSSRKYLYLTYCASFHVQLVWYAVFLS